MTLRVGCPLSRFIVRSWQSNIGTCQILRLLSHVLILLLICYDLVWGLLTWILVVVKLLSKRASIVKVDHVLRPSA